MPGVVFEVADIVEAKRVLVPVGVELRKSCSELFGHRQAPQRVELDHNVHLVADGLADLGERLKSYLEFGWGYVIAVAALGGEIERPDLHAGNALLQQRMRQIIGVVQKRL